MPKSRPNDVLDEEGDSGSEQETSSLALPSRHSSGSTHKLPGVEAAQSPSPSHPRRDRLRASQASQSAEPKAESQHKLSMRSHSRQKPSTAVLGCLAAAALATACVAWWFKRRKLKRKVQDARQLFVKCKLTPSKAVLEAVPAPPLLSTTFVTTAA